MRILFLSHYYAPEGNAPASRLAANARRWAASGHDVTVVTSAPNVPDGKVYAGFRNRLRRQRTVEEGVRVHRIWTYIAPNSGTLRRILNYLSYWGSEFLHGWTLPRPDILIATSPQFFCAWAGVTQKWIFRLRAPLARRRVPLVIEIRDIWPESIGAVDAINNSLVLGLLQWMERAMYRQADHIVTVGDGYRRRLLERGVPEEKISIITNGVDRELLEAPADDGQAVRRNHQLGDRFVGSVIGTVGMASGLDVLVRAARQLKADGDDSIRLLVVGDGARRAELEAAAHAEGLDNLIFAGRRPKAEMSAYLAASDACLVLLKKSPLFTTVLPSKIFEAAGARRPIIIGVDGDARRLVETAGGGLFCEPEDEVALIARIRTLQADPALCRQLADNGRRYVLEHFDRDRLAAQYVSVMQRTCGVEALDRRPEFIEAG